MSSFYDNLYRQHIKIWPSEQVVSFVESNICSLQGGNVLDLGCGPGRHCIYMAKRGITAFGLDISQIAITHAQGWATKEDLGVSFAISDFQSLPFKSSFFSGLISWEAIFYGNYSDFLQNISEAFRVLASGGLFFLVFKSKEDFRFVSYPHVDEHSCESEQGLIMTCLTRREIQDLLKDHATDITIESFSYSIDNGQRVISNFLVSGIKR